MKLKAVIVLAAAVMQAAAGFGQAKICEFPEGCKSAACVTYDDAIRAHYTIALPMHEKYGFPATFFAVAGRTEISQGNRSPKRGTLNWDELLDMQKRGMEIGNHTMTHASCAKLAKEEDGEAKLRMEIVESKQLMEKHGIKVRSLAYGYNAIPREGEPLLRETGQYARRWQKMTQTKDTEETYAGWVKEFLKPGTFGVIMVHGVAAGTGGWNPISNEKLYGRMLELLAAERDRIYLGTFGEISEYRDRARRCRIVETGNGKWRVAFERGDGKCGPGPVWVIPPDGKRISVGGKELESNAHRAVRLETGTEFEVKSARSASDESATPR